jgi:LAGLIDADG DNA endonuclease family protein
MGRRPRHADFFRVWTPQMAYVLGLWWTDGSMRIKSNTGAHEVNIGNNDRELLETVGQVIGGNYDLRKVSQDSNCYRISFCSKEMYQDIQAHGGMPRKSKIIAFPYVPLDLLPHYVRAVVDGDGTLSWNGDKPILHIYSGSRQFLSDLASAVAGATGIPAPNVNRNRRIWYIKWSTVRAKCLVAWLYADNPGLALGCKAAIAARFLEWRPRTPLRGTITDEMRRNFPGYLPS